MCLLTGHGTLDSSIDALRHGAFDYLRKPCSVDETEVSLRRALEDQALLERNAILRSGLAGHPQGEDVAGSCERFRAVLELADRVAESEANVLLLGETGAGKDVLARRIHEMSGRAQQPFVVVDCASLHKDLLQNELFGHDRGSFTGAAGGKHGLFEVADGGTLLLDEIGDTSLETQKKLLRVIETGSFRHLGGTREIQVDVRVLAATNRDLQLLMERGEFRSDLYFRLSTIRLEVPPLRERLEDVPDLAHLFVDRITARMGRPKRMSTAFLDRLQKYHWPGNVRELLHVIERAVVLSADECIGTEHLPPEVLGRAESDSPGLQTLVDLERDHIVRVLKAVALNRARAAEILGISERTLYRKLATYGLDE